MSLVIFAVGNPSRGDDALGPLLMAELETQSLPGVTLVTDFQLQIEHALDLDGHDLALFIDAGTGTPAPFDFYEVSASAGMSITTHALTPSAVLQVHAQLRPVTPPAFVLCIRGDHFELGEGPGEAARTHLQAARAHLAECLALPDALAWRQWQTHDGAARPAPERV
ncbi:hydrogenase maturation protease [Zoogloea sp.]|jgi:hydrogenase maturation protease|uniref:hydrogenase maturation protease n=1 Tax=Zoogloea sp. TaxID=49181 RepID=UPI001D25AD6B|nr:hydrogenase maturation protease [Zoogloea sp.]MBK6656476.1 hydrogenase maturation protease [Zoogloea sp.]HOY01149.1 hydrogenase maturation protease [Zoogloea sp.]HPI60091.1 hydrogenase maturation protease [Zoogloea sp.]